jgi:hypothetical protein
MYGGYFALFSLFLNCLCSQCFDMLVDYFASLFSLVDCL